MSNKKILTGVLIFGMTLVFAGCGKATIETREASQEEVKNEEVLPEPTGKIDDVVDAVFSDAEAETVEMTKEETDAMASLDDSQETSDFGQSYDENEF